MFAISLDEILRQEDQPTKHQTSSDENILSVILRTWRDRFCVANLLLRGTKGLISNSIRQIFTVLCHRKWDILDFYPNLDDRTTLQYKRHSG